jgi:hypothetical protein
MQKKDNSISNFLKIWKHDVLCLQETKMERIIVGIVQSLWGGSTSLLSLWWYPINVG